MIFAKVIADSISPEQHRLTTFELEYPKFVHGEFMTHRVISRNASSSRATPVGKNIEEVRSNRRAEPVFWGSEQRGMSPGAELSVDDRLIAKHLWSRAALDAADIAEELLTLGAHKSIINRVLEPFLHIRVVAGATEWTNFFGLRLDGAADPTMRALARSMWAAREASVPRPLIPGEWHLPYVDLEDEEDNRAIANYHHMYGDDELVLAKKVSAARCARVSYRSFDTQKRSAVHEDLALYGKLVGAQPLHASPTEHQATPDEQGPVTGWANSRLHGNLVGWCQFRKELPGEACAPLPPQYLTAPGE
jgi:thymidylate synthase ThyX